MAQFTIHSLLPKSACCLAQIALMVAATALNTPAFAASLVRTTPNETGYATTVTTNGSIDEKNPFFQSLGTNGRACVDCHQADAAWSITPDGLRHVFEKTAGLAPVFRVNDGANSPLADVSTIEKRRAAYTMLLNKGVIRIGLPIPADADFELIAVSDPYNYASGAELSLFRRPLPGTNVRFVSAVMWDGRNTFEPIHSVDSLKSNLQRQALGAILGHAQATVPPTPAQLRSIVDFVFGLHTAQTWDNAAGNLNARQGRGGPDTLVNQDFYIGINDPIGLNPNGTAFDPNAMQLFGKWKRLAGPGNDPADFGDIQSRNAARQAVARGEEIFNTRTIAITGVAGLNDTLNIPVLQGTCTTCHDTPNVGNHSVAMALNIGISDEARRTPDMPLYSLRNKANGIVVRTTDPGRALITGKWADIGKFKGPVLRALAARPPYFHNGSAASLSEVVQFYKARFNIGLTTEETSDLIAFLRTL